MRPLAAVSLSCPSMSEYLAAAAQVLSVPEVLVQRSAEARAKATGADVDSILKAWAGGESVAASAPAPAAAPADSAPPAAAPAAAEPAAAAAAAPVAVAAAPVTAVAVMEPPTPIVDEEVVAEPLSERIRVASRVGALTGLLLALTGLVFSAQFFAATAGVTGDEEGYLSTVIGVDPGSLVLTSMLLSIAIGAGVAGAARLLPSWTSRGMKLMGSALPSVALGVIVGALVGAMAGGIIAGTGTPPELPDDPTTVPALSSVVWFLLAWLAGGWMIGALVQSLGVPEGVDDHDSEEVATVKERLVSAVALPVVIALAMLVMVLAFAFVFISFPSWSPFTGTIIAGSILAFASLSASKPNMKVGLQEILVGAAGIGVAVILVYAVLQTTSEGEAHGEEEADGVITEEGADDGETADIGVVDPEGEARISLVF
jgi:MFS family permease